MRLTSALPVRSKALARSWIQDVTSESAGPPWGGLYLKPPSAGGLCDGVITMPSLMVVGAAAVVDKDRVRDHRRRRHAVVALENGLDALGGQRPRAPSAAPARRGRACPCPGTGAVDPSVATVVADRPGDRHDVRLGERIVERRAPVAAGAEGDALARVARIGPVGMIGPLERGDVDQDAHGSRLTCQGMNRPSGCSPG